jgi:hypothetical protein
VKSGLLIPPLSSAFRPIIHKEPASSAVSCTCLIAPNTFGLASPSKDRSHGIEQCRLRGTDPFTRTQQTADLSTLGIKRALDVGKLPLVQQPAMASENTIQISANDAGDKKLLIKQAVEKVRTFLVALSG